MAVLILPGSKAISEHRPRFYALNPGSPQTVGLRWLSHFDGHANNCAGGKEQVVSSSGVTYTPWGAQFDATTDYIDFGDVTTFDGWSAITVSAWVRLDALGAARRWFSKWSSSGGYSLLLGNRDDSNSDLTLGVAGDGTYEAWGTGAGQAGAVGLYHVVWSWDANRTGSGGHVLYLNGRQTTLVEVYDPGDPTSIGAASSPLRFGAQSDATEALVGEWRHCAIYNRALTAAEAYALYDPATRWDLYWQPARRLWLDLGAAPVTASASEYSDIDTISSSNW